MLNEDFSLYIPGDFVGGIFHGPVFEKRGVKNENSEIVFKGICVTHQNVRINESNPSMKLFFTYHTPGGRTGRFLRWPPRKSCISYRRCAVIIQHAIFVSNFI